MAKVTVTLEGFEQVRAAVTRVPEHANEHLAQAVRLSTFSAAQRTKALAPRGATGTLRNAISSSVRGLSGRVTVDPSGFYWRFLEYGTRHQAAQPFVRTAAELESREFEDRVRQVGVKLERDFSAGRFL
jgi:HK97 gp10 family phage protein